MYSLFSHRIARTAVAMYAAQACRSASLMVIVCAIAMTGTCERTHAATVDNWNVNSGGSWNTGANWSTGSIPTIADDAVIGPVATSLSSPASITLNANQTAYGLTLNPGPGK